MSHLCTMNAVVLAGGKNSRINRKKAFIRINSQTIIEKTVRLLQNQFNRVLIISNERDDFTRFSLPVIPDIIKNKGPLGGIYTGLQASDTHHTFFVACDMPFLKEHVITALIEQAEGYDVVIPEHLGYLEPLCAIYSQTCIPVISKNLNTGQLKIKTILNDVRVKKIVWNESDICCEEGTFFNINTNHDLLTALKYAKQQVPVPVIASGR